MTSPGPYAPRALDTPRYSRPPDETEDQAIERMIGELGAEPRIVAVVVTNGPRADELPVADGS